MASAVKYLLNVEIMNFEFICNLLGAKHCDRYIEHYLNLENVHSSVDYSVWAHGASTENPWEAPRSRSWK